MKKFTLGPGNKAVPVPKDPDTAETIQFGSDVPPFPSIQYVRKKHFVMLHLTGMWDRGYADKKAAIKAWNDKLLKLPRVPQ